MWFVCMYTDSTLTSTAGDGGGALVYPEGQRKVLIPTSHSHYGKHSQATLSQGEDEVFAGPSVLQPRRDLTFDLPDINTPPWSRLEASSCSQPDYLSNENLVNERDTLSWWVK